MKPFVLELCQGVEALLDAKKAVDCVRIDLGEHSPIADCFLIASGTSEPHLAALALHLQKYFKAHNLSATVSGLEGRKWVIVDGGVLMVHLFLPEVRGFYNLEKLWGCMEGIADG
jgi:ribosome-associated protein